MRIFYRICCVLAIAIISFAADNGAMGKSVAETDTPGTSHSTIVNSSVTTAVPPNPVTDTVKTTNNMTSTSVHDDKSSTTTPVPTPSPPSPPTTPPTTKSTTTSTTTTQITTSKPPSTTPTTTSTTTAQPTTHDPKPQPPTFPTPTTAPPSSTEHPLTTPYPPSPSKGRSFDGWSFIGGMFLATALIGLAAFSFKFYRTCNEGNYRTL